MSESWWLIPPTEEPRPTCGWPVRWRSTEEAQEIAREGFIAEMAQRGRKAEVKFDPLVVKVEGGEKGLYDPPRYWGEMIVGRINTAVLDPIRCGAPAVIAFKKSDTREEWYPPFSFGPGAPEPRVIYKPNTGAYCAACAARLKGPDYWIARALLDWWKDPEASASRLPVITTEQIDFVRREQ